MTKSDRTGTGTLSVFGHQMRFDLAQGFPLLTTKKLHLRSIIHELLWFLRGDTNVRWLQEHGVTHLGRVGGRGGRARARSTATSGAPGRRRTGGTIDQIASVIEQIRDQPRLAPAHRQRLERRRTSTTMALPPCHALFQFYVADGRLSCQLYQRSADVFLGVPFNIASYALLTMMVAQVCGLEPGDFVHTLGDAHLYLNHLDQARLQLTREPRPAAPADAQPRGRSHLRLRATRTSAEGYDPHPAHQGADRRMTVIA